MAELCNKDDFLKMLNYDSDNDSDNTDSNEDNKCLISRDLLDTTKVTLPCKHSFNYVPLYKEVFNQKKKLTVTEVVRLRYNQIKCPYCRQKMNNLLPHVRLNKEMCFISGVNTPEKMCMDFHTCNYLFKSGKNKDNCCPKPAYFDVEGCYCSTHHAYALKQKMKKSSKIFKNNVTTQGISSLRADAIVVSIRTKN